MSASIHIADILRAAFPEYLRLHGPLPAEHYRAVNAILSCRTESRGAHEYRCDQCGEPKLQYHSCRNRHCPRCQGYASRQWVQNRVDELLPVSHFHVVFTIPHELNPFALRNKRALYTILYRAVSDTIIQLTGQDKWLGARIGMIAVLHTWGQNLTDHPHIHCIIPAGGLSHDRWVHCKNDFLVPVAVLRKVFRGKFMAYFKEAIAQNEVGFHGMLQEYQRDPARLSVLMDDLYRKEWVVFIKQPFADPAAVLSYLGRYTHRVAIAEQRILAFDGSTVTFAYTDYAHGSRRRTMTLSAVEFIRRFLLHVLPKGLMRIRHFGIFANRRRRELIACARKLLGAAPPVVRKVLPWWQAMLERTGKNPLACPVCTKGTLVLVAITFSGRSCCMVT